LPGPPPGDRERVPGPGAGRAPAPTRRQRLKLLVIVGPTGTGKTETALIVARRIGGEIVGCDALQVYRGLDTATAKPSASQRALIPHHLVDVADPRRDFSLADYVRAAEKAVREIDRRGSVPLVVGGTGLYLRGLLRGIIPAPDRDAALRDRLRRMSRRFGTARLHRCLRGLDEESANRLPPNDTQRIVRALELALSGETWSARLRREGTWAGCAERYDSLKIGLDMDREVLDRRLRDRVEAFFDAGLVDEVRALLEAGVPREANALKAIGYREVIRALESGADPRDEIEEVIRNTRRYAKRQRTWFRREPGLRWLDLSGGPGEAADRIVDLWRE
jgi:tRNA dimethylallyltransferase